MQVIRRISLWVAGAFVLSTGLAFAQITIPISEEQVLYEVIGEFNNSGLASQQFGYFADITGLNNVFGSPTTKNETTALFTFVTNATTFQVVNNGPFRIV